MHKKQKTSNNKFEGEKMRKTKRIFIIAFLLCIYIYCCKIDSIPNSIILYGGEQLNLGNFLGISLKIGDKDCNTILASSDITGNSDSNKNEATVDVKLFNTINVKEVSVSIIDKTTVIPVGQVSGLKLYTNGVLVVGMSEIKGEDSQKYKPYENSGIEEGDRIIKIEEKEISDTNEFFAALGHGITDSDTGKLVEIQNG